MSKIINKNTISKEINKVEKNSITLKLILK